MMKEPYVTPITPTTPAPERDPELRARAEEYLSYLSPRAQTILRLRYGLGDEDERAYSVIEIAGILRLSREAVNYSISQSIARLRALVEGKATITRRNGKACISCPALFERAIKPEQEAALLRACVELEAEGAAITRRSLARAAGVGLNPTQTFLRAYRPQPPRETREQEREARLEQAYNRLVSQGQSLRANTLAREAHVGDRAARHFLKERKGKSHVPA